MPRNTQLFLTVLFACLVLSFAMIFNPLPAMAGNPAQIPTGSVPTVTGTPLGPMGLVVGDGQQDQINVRAGPNTATYPIVGVIIVGQSVPILGISAGGDWVEIAYPGVASGRAWLYKPYVQVSGNPGIVEPPATPTPKVTPTIDPTLAAQFLVDVPPTRLPTFTAPAPLNLPTYQPDTPSVQAGRVPMGLVIIGMASIGLLGTLLSFLRGR